MKSVYPVVLAIAVALTFASCSSLPVDSLSSLGNIVTSSAVSGGSSGAGSGGAVSGSRAAPVDFQAGEILCTTARSMVNASFDLARILTAPSPATKNQAEVVYIDGGKKEWVNFAVNSRKAVKADLVVGAYAFYCVEWDEVGADQYRKLSWHLGVVTSVDDLYKGRVEIGGDSYKVDYVRVPTDPVK